MCLKDRLLFSGGRSDMYNTVPEHATIVFFQSFLREFHTTVNQRVNSVIFAHSGILTWEIFCTALADNDSTRSDYLTAKNFNAKSFGL